MLVPITFVFASFLIELTPGPNMAYLAVLSAREGRRAGFAAAFGVAVGLLIVGTAAALGLSAIIATSRWLYEFLRWAGVLYLLWLAWEGWRGEEETSPGTAKQGDAHSKFFVRGLMTNLLNPKAALFYVAVLPTFVSPSLPATTQIITLTAVYVAIATLVHCVIVLLAGAAQPWLGDTRRSKIARRVLSILLAVIAVWLLVATRYEAPLP